MSAAEVLSPGFFLVLTVNFVDLPPSNRLIEQVLSFPMAALTECLRKARGLKQGDLGQGVLNKL